MKQRVMVYTILPFQEAGPGGGEVVTALSTVPDKALDCEVMSRNAGCVCLGEEKKGLKNFSNGGMGISMNVMQMSLGLQGQWIQLVC